MTQKKYGWIILVMLVLSFTFSSFLAANAQGTDVVVSSITLSEPFLQILKGKPATLKADIQPANAKNRKLEWLSSDDSIATVKNGRIEGKKNGECDITCAAADGSGVAATCHVEVKTEVRKIEIQEKKVNLLVGSTDEAASAKLTYSITPEDASWQDVTWTSSDEQVVTVDEKGVLRGIDIGKANITASSTQPGSKVKAQIQVVVGKAVESISFEQKQVVLLVGKIISLKPAVSPDRASNKALEWHSEDKSVASVDSRGQIKGNSFGTTKIVAKATDGSDVKAEIEVTVVKPELTVTIDADTYDYAKSVEVTATISNPDGTTTGLDELFPNAKLSAELQTKKGKHVPWYIIQKHSSLSHVFSFPMEEVNLEAGDYKIHVESNVLRLKTDSAVFHYTADRSWIPDPKDCSIELQLSSDQMNLNEDFRMTAIVTDKDGNYVPGIKVGFEVLNINRESSRFFSYNWLWQVTNTEGRCSIQCSRDKEEAKRIPAGQYIVRAFIVNEAGSDEKTFEFTGKEI